MNRQPTMATDELVAEYVRSAMRIELPPTLADEVMRAVATTPQAKRGRWPGFGPSPLVPALGAVVAAALILAVSVLLFLPRNVGPAPDATPTPVPTITPEGARVLTQPGDTIVLPAMDSEGQFGTITVQRGQERAGYPDYMPFTAMFLEEVFFVELLFTYEIDRHTPDPYGANDFAYAVDANGNGLDERDAVTQWAGMSWEGTTPQGGPEPQLPFMGFGDRPITGWVVAELPAAGARFDIYLVHIVDTTEEAVAAPFEVLASALLREPGDPVGVTTFDPSSLPTPAPGEPVPTFSTHPLPTPPPSAAATFEPVPDADADALFAEPQACTNDKIGVRIAYPAGWYTNEAYEDLVACSLFSSEPIDAEVVYQGFVASQQMVSVSRRPAWTGGIEEPMVERVPIGDRVAWTVTWREDQQSGPGPIYLLPLTEDQYGPFLTTAASEETRAIVERMLIRLEFIE